MLMLSKLMLTLGPYTIHMQLLPITHMQLLPTTHMHLLPTTHMDLLPTTHLPPRTPMPSAITSQLSLKRSLQNSRQCSMKCSLKCSQQCSQQRSLKCSQQCSLKCSQQCRMKCSLQRISLPRTPVMPTTHMLLRLITHGHLSQLIMRLTHGHLSLLSTPLQLITHGLLSQPNISLTHGHLTHGRLSKPNMRLRRRRLPRWRRLNLPMIHTPTGITTDTRCQATATLGNTTITSHTLLPRRLTRPLSSPPSSSMTNTVSAHSPTRATPLTLFSSSRKSGRPRQSRAPSKAKA